MNTHLSLDAGIRDLPRLSGFQEETGWQAKLDRILGDGPVDPLDLWSELLSRYDAPGMIGTFNLGRYLDQCKLDGRTGRRKVARDQLWTCVQVFEHLVLSWWEDRTDPSEPGHVSAAPLLTISTRYLSEQQSDSPRGYHLAWAPAAFIYHFGAWTREATLLQPGGKGGWHPTGRVLSGFGLFEEAQ